MEEIKPCAHCGGEAGIQMIGNVRVECKRCLAQGEPFHPINKQASISEAKVNAAKAWNTRASVSHADLQKVIDAFTHHQTKKALNTGCEMLIKELEALLEQ